MAQSTLEERVAALEKQVAQLMANGAAARPSGGTRQKNWRRTIGMFAGDEAMKRIDAAGRAWRKKQRRHKPRQAKA